MKKIIAFAGSNSSNSINHQLIKAVAKLVDGIEVEIIKLTDYPAGIYGIDEETKNGFPQSMVDLKNKLSEADGYIISSPEHNGSIPTVFKNAIDWLSRQGRAVLNDKPTLLLSTSPGARGGKTVLDHLVAILPYQGAKVIGSHALGSFGEKVQNETLVDGIDKDQINQLVKDLVSAI